MLTSTTRISVRPFSRQVDGEEVVIGLPESATFLALPADAVGLIDELAKGRTVGEVRDEYAVRTGEIPDLEDLLSYLEERGFVHFQEGEGQALPQRVQGSPTVRYHFAGVPQGLARALFSLPVLVASAAVTLLAVVAIALEPSLIPGWRDLLFHEHVTFATVAIVVLYFMTVVNHELAHLVAARAVGVSSRLGIGHRLWMLVAETDLSGLWALPAKQRYLPLLAGPVVDVASASVLILVLFAGQRHWIALAPAVVIVLRALVFIYALALLWQLFFFVRTDFYYVVATYFNCKNLLKDTEARLKNGLRRFLPARWRPRLVDQSNIPAGEMRVIRLYGGVWVLGRVAALLTFFLLQLPLMIAYVRLIAATLGRGYAADPQAFLDVLFMTAFITLPLLAGLALWIRSLSGGALRALRT